MDALTCTGYIKGDKKIVLTDLIDGRLAELRRDIKSMKLYNKPELVTALHRRLAAKGIAKGPVQFSALNEFDLNLYRGTEALEKAVADIGLQTTSRVISIGSGLGGPARYVAGTSGCQVLACELQGDLHGTAQELTQRAGLTKVVHHIHGNFMDISQHLQLSAYDGIMSWLTVLHFDDRPMLFRRCYELLRPGGVFYAGDFFETGKFTPEEARVLREDVSCPSLYSSTSAYKSDLEKAGFKVTVVEDVTQSWKDYTHQRYNSFKADRPQQVAVLGTSLVDCASMPLLLRHMAHTCLPGFLLATCLPHSPEGAPTAICCVAVDSLLCLALLPRPWRSPAGESVYDGLLSFYALIDGLYQGGNLGGVRIVAKKVRALHRNWHHVYLFFFLEPQT